MKLRLKILEENVLLKEGNEGLYKLMGVKPGTLDIFLETFTGSSPSHQEALRGFISSRFGPQIEALTDEDLPDTDPRGYSTSLSKVKALLSNGVLYWWYQLFGLDAARLLVRYQVISYYMDLEDAIESINFEGKGYSEITSEDFAKLPEEDKNIIYEKHFWEDYLDSFFDKQMAQASDTGNKYAGGAGIPSGLFGTMNDWWMSTDGRGIMKAEMREAGNELYQQFRKEDSAEEPPEQKEPQWFEKGVNAWDDDAVGYDKREDVPKPL